MTLAPPSVPHAYYVERGWGDADNSAVINLFLGEARK